ncbi:hypothetical protein D9M68_527470 [compost metagenome]
MHTRGIFAHFHSGKIIIKGNMKIGFIDFTRYRIGGHGIIVALITKFQCTHFLVYLRNSVRKIV